MSGIVPEEKVGVQGCRGGYHLNAGRHFAVGSDLDGKIIFAVEIKVRGKARGCAEVAGYDAVGVAEICMASDASKGAFYHHFESKESLFMELLDEWLAKLDANLLQIFEQDFSLEAGIHAILGILKEVAWEGSKQYSIFLEFFIF